jgi:hypothetical protein
MAFFYKVSKQEGFRCAETPEVEYNKKEKRAIKAVKKSVIRKKIADSKRPLKWTGRYIYQNGIATREMK